jgi:ABC-type bacteriocin/lantibiotic exporter with double-glycine peptidase domain
VTVALLLAAALAVAQPQAELLLPVPVIAQAPERCGPAALAMVLQFHGADSALVASAQRAYDPILRGALITDLAEVARTAGWRAEVVRPSDDSLRTWLSHGTPAILLYARGIGPITRGHYGVLVGWDEARDRLTLNDGGSRSRRVGRGAFLRRWRGAGGQALIVRPALP